METEYITKDQLIGFDNYKYSCKDTGILSNYVMHPFWNWTVQFFPRWIAPNLMTFTGFLFTVASFLLYTLMDYNFYASDPDYPDYPALPKWTFLTIAIFLFVAYTLDGLDGKQARRTGTSTPLGELFDHGLDSYSAGLIGVLMYSIFGRGVRYSISPFRMFFTMWNVLLNFYIAHFEKYNTGILFLPWGYDFAMCGTIITFFIAGVYGHEIWQFNNGGIRTGLIFEIILYISSLVSNVPIVFYNIYKSYKYKTGHMRPFTEAIRPLIPVIFFFSLTLMWVLLSPSNIVERDPRALFFLISTIFSNISCRLIVAQMSSTRCDAFNALLYPTVAVVAISITTQSAILELSLMYLLCIIATFAHIHYGTYVVRQMCRHFGVECFSINKHLKD